MKILFNKKTYIISGLVLIVLSTMFFTINAFAAPVVGFEPGRIIDDAVFTNNQSMSVSQIQAFLNSKVPICDNWGTNGSTPTARRDYFISRGFPIPLTCLKDYQENGRSSSQIIYDTAQEFNINPQVLIVLLQKEQGLVTDDWPAPWQYKTATGYGCPDTAACDSQYYGLTKQLSWSARMFRAILNDSPTWYTPYETGWNYIQYNPDSSCGGSMVNIQNRSTQSLYNYTPYQPNASSLNAGYGSGDYCGAYGNRNFYQYFKDWFGSTIATNGTITISKGLTVNKSSVLAGDTVTASYEITNSANYTVEAGGFGICARLNGENYDFGFNPTNNIPNNSSLTVSYSKKIENSGTLMIFSCSFLPQIGGWVGDTYPYNINNLTKTSTLQVKENPLITTGVSFSPTSPAIGQPVTATFTVTNSSSSPVSMGSPTVAVRGPRGTNYDFTAESNVTIPANSTFTYSKTRTFTEAGAYIFFTSTLKDNIWNEGYPKLANDNIVRWGTLQVK